MKSQKGNIVGNSGGLWGNADVSGPFARQVAHAQYSLQTANPQHSLRTANARQVADFFLQRELHFFCS